MIIPHTTLTSEALRGVIEEFVSREGTDYGEVAYSLDDKVAQVRRQIEIGEIALVFDQRSETCDLVSVRSQRYKKMLAESSNEVSGE